MPKLYTPPVTTQIDSRHYEMDLSGDKVNIGSASNEFTPVIRFNRFNLESFVELNLVGGGNVTKFTDASLINGVVTAENDYLKIEYKAVELKPPYNEFGGVDYKITVKQNPGLNTITFTYNHQHCNAYLQPPLTQAEIDEGCIRHDYVVNSIAFYHDTKGGLVTGAESNIGLTTGKIGHLYRMRVTDSSPTPKTTWADWGFGGGQSQITLTIPSDWLATAVYPIVIAPIGDTFGNTNLGATAGGNLNVYGPYRSVYTMGASNGTATSMMAGTRNDTLDSSTLHYKGAIYSGANVITNGLTGEAHDAKDLTNHWIDNTMDFATPPSLTASAEYWLALACVDGSAYGPVSAYDTGGTHGYDTTGYTFPDPWSDDGSGTRKYSYYVTYTPSGGGDIIKSRVPLGANKRR